MVTRYSRLPAQTASSIADVNVVKVPSPWLRESPGALLGAIREAHEPLSKTDLAGLLLLSRTAVAQRVDVLEDAGLLRRAAPRAEARGRPADRYELDPDFGVTLIADTGATGMRLAVCDLAGNLRAETTADIDIATGPAPILDAVVEGFSALLRELDEPRTRVRGIGLDVPGPVDHVRARVINPPIMTGWHDFDIRQRFSQDFDCPVVLEKDVNAMAFGEQRLVHPEIDDLLYLKLGTGIGTGLMLRGDIYRGADGAAGDVGHTPVARAGETDAAPLCRCGNRGCLEAYASGWALARDLRDAGIAVTRVSDIVTLVNQGEPKAIAAVRAAARTIGGAVSDLVSILNPRVILVGGQLAGADGMLISGIGQEVYSRSLPLATRDLRIVPNSLGKRAGVHGLATLVADEVLSIDRVNASVRQ